MRRLIEPDQEWVTTTEAARYLQRTEAKLCSSDEVRKFVRTKSRSPRGASARSVGLLWNLEDLKALRSAADAAGMTCGATAKVLAARREGRV